MRSLPELHSAPPLRRDTRSSPCAAAAQVVRRSLKEPMKTKALTRDNTTMKVVSFEGGKKTGTRMCPSTRP